MSVKRFYSPGRAGGLTRTKKRGSGKIPYETPKRPREAPGSFQRHLWPDRAPLKLGPCPSFWASGGIWYPWLPTGSQHGKMEKRFTCREESRTEKAEHTAKQAIRAKAIAGQIGSRRPAVKGGGTQRPCLQVPAGAEPCTGRALVARDFRAILISCSDRNPHPAEPISAAGWQNAGQQPCNIASIWEYV